MKKKHVGSTLGSFLEERGIRERTDALTYKKLIVERTRSLMKRRHVTRAELARRMSTSATSIDRLLDPATTGLTLETISKLSAALDAEIISVKRSA